MPLPQRKAGEQPRDTIQLADEPEQREHFCDGKQSEQLRVVAEAELQRRLASERQSGPRPTVQQQESAHESAAGRKFNFWK